MSLFLPSVMSREQSLVQMPPRRWNRSLVSVFTALSDYLWPPDLCRLCYLHPEARTYRVEMEKTTNSTRQQRARHQTAQAFLHCHQLWHLEVKLWILLQGAWGDTVAQQQPPPMPTLSLSAHLPFHSRGSSRGQHPAPATARIHPGSWQGRSALTEGEAKEI